MAITRFFKEKMYGIEIEGADLSLGFQSLDHCLMVRIAQAFLIRMGSILTQEQSKEYQHLMIKLHSQSDGKDRSLRVASIQLDLPSTEWNVINGQHYRLRELVDKIEGQGRVAHLSLPTNPLFIPNKTERPPIGYQENLNKITQLLNTEGWLTYCYWMNEDIEQVMHRFKYDAVDEYRLESIFTHFSDEVRSSLLRGKINHIEQLTRKLIAIEEKEIPHQEQEALSLDKELFMTRNDVQSNLETQYQWLKSAEEEIRLILKAHPKLISIWFRMKLLLRLLADAIGIPNLNSLDWGEKLMHLALLNRELGVFSSLHCHQNFERVSFAFSVMSSALIVTTSLKKSTQVNFLNSLNDIIANINKMASDDEKHYMKLSEKSKYVVDFQKHVFHFLQKYGGEFPLPKEHFEEGKHINTDLIRYLPPTEKCKILDNDHT